MQLPLHTYHCGPALEKGTANLSSFYPRGWRQIRYWRWHTSLQSFERRGKHTVGFSPKHGHFCPTFRDKIDESFWKFSNLTLVLLDFYSAARSLVWKNAGTILKVSIFLVKSNSVRVVAHTSLQSISLAA